MRYAAMLVFLALWIVMVVPVSREFLAHQDLVNSPALTAAVPGIVRNFWLAWYPVLALFFSFALVALALRRME